MVLKNPLVKDKLGEQQVRLNFGSLLGFAKVGLSFQEKSGSLRHVGFTVPLLYLYEFSYLLR
jgi:hypothetical protein